MLSYTVTNRPVDATLRAVLRHACESSYNVPGERFLRFFLTLDNAVGLSAFSSSDPWLELLSSSITTGFDYTTIE
jgi:hypothetical protein